MVVAVVDVVFVLVVATVPVVAALLFAFPPYAVVDALSPALTAPGVVVRHPAGEGILQSSASSSPSPSTP